MNSHGSAPRGLDPRRPQPLSPLFEGRFGRMFRRLPPCPPLAPKKLHELAETMREPEPPSEELDNPDIPAGYTYFGQFLDHDITFDPVATFDRENDPDALASFRTPRFDLDSLYGSGPADEPFQYDRNAPGRFLIGVSADQADLPRNAQGIALIGDPRNDENVIVSGLQLAFLLLHNKLLDQAIADGVPEGQCFEEAQRRLRWHYQWVSCTTC
jgi:hypothetical protein